MRAASSFPSKSDGSAKAARKRSYDAAIRRITEQAYWLPLHTYVTTYGLQKQLELPTFPDELPRFYLAKWK